MCLEHIAASKHSFIGLVQRLLFRPWRWFFDGCHTHRALDRLLETSGFSELELERYQARTLFIPIRPQMIAVAKR